MKQIRKFLRLTASDRWLLVKAFFAVALVRLGLWILPFKTLQILAIKFETVKMRSRSGGRSETVDRVVRAIRIASRRLPAATCLTQAIATKILLRRRGHQPTLRIGVAKSESGEFLAHAWLEHEGTIVLGDLSDLARYSSFSSGSDEDS